MSNLLRTMRRNLSESNPKPAAKLDGANPLRRGFRNSTVRARHAAKARAMRAMQIAFEAGRESMTVTYKAKSAWARIKGAVARVFKSQRGR